MVPKNFKLLQNLESQIKFQVETKNNIEEQYCQLYCNGAVSAYLITKRPSNNNKCVMHFNYKASSFSFYSIFLSHTVSKSENQILANGSHLSDHVSGSFFEKPKAVLKPRLKA